MNAEQLRGLFEEWRQERAKLSVICGECSNPERDRAGLELRLEGDEVSLLACGICGQLYRLESLWEEEESTMFSDGKRWQVGERLTPVDSDRARDWMIGFLPNVRLPASGPAPAPPEAQPAVSRCPSCRSTDVECKSAVGVGSDLFAEMRCRACGHVEVVDEYQRWESF